MPNFYEMKSMSSEKAQGLRGPESSGMKKKGLPNKSQSKTFNSQEPDEASAIIHSNGASRKGTIKSNREQVAEIDQKRKDLEQ